jgi:alkylhydroperoxidase family enzyme
VETVACGKPPADARFLALHELTVRMTAEPASVGPAEIDALRGEGLDDAAIHDAIQVIAYFNYINRVADAVGIEDEPEWGVPEPG